MESVGGGGFRIAVDAANVYWTSFSNPGTVMKVSVNGGSVTTLACGQGQPSDIADATSVYWTTLSNYDSTGTVMKLTPK